MKASQTWADFTLFRLEENMPVAKYDIVTSRRIDAVLINISQSELVQARIKRSISTPRHWSTEAQSLSDYQQCICFNSLVSQHRCLSSHFLSPQLRFWRAGWNAPLSTRVCSQDHHSANGIKPSLGVGHRDLFPEESRYSSRLGTLGIPPLEEENKCGILSEDLQAWFVLPHRRRSVGNRNKEFVIRCLCLKLILWKDGRLVPDKNSCEASARVNTAMLMMRGLRHVKTDRIAHFQLIMALNFYSIE